MNSRWLALLCLPMAALAIGSSSTDARAESARENYLPLAGTMASPDDVAVYGERRQLSRRTDHFRIGALGGLGFPRPLAIEGMAVIERAVGLGVEYSVLPSMTIADVRTRFWALAADLRLFPLRGPFFVGMRAGHQQLTGTTSVEVARYGTFSGAARVDTTFVNPRIGFLWTWAPGITLGIDAGVQLPLSSSTSTTVPARLTSAFPELVSTAESFGKSVLPTVDLLRVGFLL